MGPRISKLVNHLRCSVRRLKIKCCLLYLRPYFTNANERLKQLLKINGFHYSLFLRPNLLFRYEPGSQLRLFPHSCDFVLKKLKSYIEIGWFNSRKDIEMLKNLKLNDMYSRDISMMLDGKRFKCYDINDVDIRGEKVVVYTVLTGNYDYVHELLYKQSNVDYVLFTNNRKIVSDTWKVKYVESDLDDLLLSREIKILPYKYLNGFYTASIYIDANAYIYGDIANLCSYLYNGITFMGTRHYCNNSIRDEINACISCGKIKDVDEIWRQYGRYVDEGFRDDLGLMECGLLVRRHKDEKLNELMNEWWKEYKNGVHRDQISLMACIDRLNFADYVIEDGSIWYNQFETIIGH